MPEEFSKMNKLEKNISLKSRKVRKSDAREIEKDRNEANFYFQSGTFFPISNRKGAMTS